MTKVAKGHQGLKSTMSLTPTCASLSPAGSVLRSEMSEAGVDLRVISESR
jgi:hypothetical protein